jgi:hypothetical protein
VNGTRLTVAAFASVILVVLAIACIGCGSSQNPSASSAPATTGTKQAGTPTVLLFSQPG